MRKRSRSITLNADGRQITMLEVKSSAFNENIQPNKIALDLNALPLHLLYYIESFFSLETYGIFAATCKKLNARRNQSYYYQNPAYHKVYISALQRINQQWCRRNGRLQIIRDLVKDPASFQLLRSIVEPAARENTLFKTALTNPQCKGIRAGLTLMQVTQVWFTWAHAFAAMQGVPYADTKELRYDDVYPVVWNYLALEQANTEDANTGQSPSV